MAETPSSTEPAEPPASAAMNHIETSQDFTSQLQELTKIVSPKVSELLSEQALALDSYMGDFSDDSYDNDVTSSGRKKKKKNYSSDEDSMDDEWRRLENAQNDLRNELELANGLSAFMMNDVYDDDEEDSQSLGQSGREGTSNNSHDVNNGNGTQVSPQKFYTLSDHANVLGVTRPSSDKGLFSRPFLSRRDLETLNIISLPEWISNTNDASDAFPSLPYSPPTSSTNTSSTYQTYLQNMSSHTLEYIEPPSPKTLRKLYSGWNPGPGERRETNRPGTEDSNRIAAYSSSPVEQDESSVEEEYIDADGVPIPISQRRREPTPLRCVMVRIRPDVLCGSVMGCITDVVEKLGGDTIKRQGGHLRAILPGRRMRVWMEGEWEKERLDGFVQEETKHDEADGVRREDGEDESSIATGITSLLFSSPKPRNKGPKYVNLPPYLIDCQLVTKKLGKTCHRLLLVRVYRIQDCMDVGDDDEEEILDVPAPLNDNDNTVDLEAESEKSLRELREASALVQRIKAVGGAGFAVRHPSSKISDDNDSVASRESTKSYLKSFGDAITSPIRYLSSNNSTSPHPPSSARERRRRASAPELMSKELLKKCKSSPSVGTASTSAFNAAKIKSHGVFPSLSREDSPYVKASWVFLRECIKELDTLCLSYSSLGTTPLFQFPALPTLDAHFIFQIKLMCRESMIISLVKTASDLEVYAREFEVSCSNLDQLLRPTFDLYKLEPPPLPWPLPLTAYPLDFQPPEDITPPWGADVAKALETISQQSTDQSDTKSSFDKAEEAVLITVCAFHRQNDTEQGARLGRKNMQVMDRLAKMQAHKRNSIDKIKNAYGSNLIATNTADEFHELRLKSSNLGSLSDMMHSVPDQVPLLICNVLVGNAAGTCYVTSSQILFVTQLVPILGGNRVHLFSLMDVDVTINPPSKSMLSPLPAGITLTTTIGKTSKIREEVYSFIPSIGARRFAKFLEVVKDVSMEDPNTLKFSERGGLIYMYDENM